MLLAIVDGDVVGWLATPTMGGVGTVTGTALRDKQVWKISFCHYDGLAITALP